MFKSMVKELGVFRFPVKSGTRIQMMPVRLGDPRSLPDELSHWRESFIELCGAGRFQNSGEIGYLTIDEKRVDAGKSHRRPGIHVDFFKKWIEESRRSPQDIEIVMASDMAGCRAWNQEFDGDPDPEGDCSHLSGKLVETAEVRLTPNRIYGMNRLTVHESMTMRVPTHRRFVRIVSDIVAEYYTNYTRNPLGIQPPAHVRIPGLRDNHFMNA